MEPEVHECEIVIGLVAPAGVDLGEPESIIANYLKEAGYDVHVTRMSALIERVKGLDVELAQEPYAERLRTYMNGGTRARELAGRGDVLALYAAVQIADVRAASPARANRCYIIRSFKHPEEAVTLRRIYGKGFFLVGVHAGEGARRRFLIEKRAVPREVSEKIIARDALEGPKSDSGCGTCFISRMRSCPWSPACRTASSGSWTSCSGTRTGRRPGTNTRCTSPSGPRCVRPISRARLAPS